MQPRAGPESEVLRHIQAVAGTFVQMLQDRQIADYDNSTSWTRTDAVAAVDLVDVAFESWRVIRNEPAAQNFLVTLLLKERKP